MSEKIVELKGEDRIRVGIPVCEGPGTYRLMLTWPDEREGRIIEIPVEDIESVSPACPRPRGTTPSVGD